MTTQPLRILQILRAPLGGLYRHVVDLSTELAARGHQIGVVMDSSLSDRQTFERMAGLEPNLALGVQRMPIPRLPGPRDATTPFVLRKLAKEMNIDVLHGHGAKGGLHARAARVGAKNRVSIYTPHGGALNYNPDKWSGRLFLSVERLLMTQTDAIAFESAYAREVYIERVAPPTCLSPVIHNGLAPGEFEPVIEEKDAVDFVFIGELRHAKGIMFLLDALKDVTASDGRPATLVMAGSGPMADEINEKLKTMGIADRVEMVGVQPAREMLARGRCLVVPSLAESLPYVILEGAAARRPIIATDVGGNNEIFGPTKTSLVPSADAEALRFAMQGFMDDPDAANREMETRLEHVQNGFSLKNMADEVEALYRAALAQR